MTESYTYDDYPVKPAPDYEEGYDYGGALECAIENFDNDIVQAFERRFDEEDELSRKRSICIELCKMLEPDHDPCTLIIGYAKEQPVYTTEGRQIMPNNVVPLWTQYLEMVGYYLKAAEWIDRE